MAVSVEPFKNPDKLTCKHPRCDGRPAKWWFPKTAHLGLKQPICCSVHLARFVEIIVEHRLEDAQTKSVDRAIASIAVHHSAGSR